MAVDMFLQVAGVTGESHDAHHQGWIDILSHTWGGNQPNDMSVGGGGGAGKIKFRNLRVKANIDRGCPNVLKFCANGSHLSKVIISACKAGSSQIEYYRILLEDVLVTYVEYSGKNNQENIYVEYGFQSAKIQQQYWLQTEQGTRGAECSVSYDIKANSES
jgi:type VI secretion system secreted protein Hcp